MQMYEFVGQVQYGARLPNMERALKATRATLQTLAERLGADESRHLAAQLPQGIGQYLDSYEFDAENFSSEEFLKRISAREGVDPPDCVTHVRAVLHALQHAVPVGEISHVLERLPTDYARLFPRPRLQLRRPQIQSRRYGTGY